MENTDPKLRHDLLNAVNAMRLAVRAIGVVDTVQDRLQFLDDVDSAVMELGRLMDLVDPPVMQISTAS